MVMEPAFPPRKVLVAVDGSAPSLAALTAARALAGRLGSGLEAVYVEPLLPNLLFEPEAGSLRRQQAEERLAVERLAEAAGVPLSETPGLAAAELVRRAQPGKAQLLVMGTHAREGSGRFLMGSTAEAVLHRARVPVLAVREGAVLDVREVLAPVNMESYGDDALLYAADLAASFAGRVTALHVREGYGPDDEAREALSRHLDAVLGAARAARVRRVLRRGDAREQIRLEAETGQYGLVVLSAHRRAQLSDLALGTTAERLLRGCRVPLLAVPASASRPARA